MTAETQTFKFWKTITELARIFHEASKIYPRKRDNKQL